MEEKDLKAIAEIMKNYLDDITQLQQHNEEVDENVLMENIVGSLADYFEEESKKVFVNKDRELVFNKKKFIKDCGC